MEKSKRLEIKVGLFMAVGLILLAVMLLQFSKSSSIFRGSYEIRLHASNVGGIKPRAQVLLAGVQVGSVGEIQLADYGRSVTISLHIYKDYTIYTNAEFVIQQAGFLGDQYVAIIPAANRPPNLDSLKDGADVPCEEPFDLQEVARATAGFIKRLNGTAQKLDDSVVEFRAQVLNERTLTNFDVALNNLRTVSEQAIATVGGLDQLVTTNRDQVGTAVSNLVYFSHQLNGLADSANGILASNAVRVDAATKNIADSAETLKSVVDDIKAGKGLAGTILQNQELSSNVQSIAYNLSVTTSNLNRHGLWGILWSHKTAETPATNSPTPDHP